jgi:hypothetical protein
MPKMAEEGLVLEDSPEESAIDETVDLEATDLHSEEEGSTEELILEPEQAINEIIDFQPFSDLMTINDEFDARPGHIGLTNHIEEALSEYLEPLEEVKTEKVKTIFADIIVTARKIRELDEADGEGQEIIKQELEELFIDLMECLGIDYEPEVINQFVQSFVIHRLQNAETTNYGFTPEFLDEGTHEQKPGYLGVLKTLVDIARQSVSPLALLGRLALVRSVASQG